MKVRVCSAADLDHVVRHLRPHNRAELFATRWEEPDAPGALERLVEQYLAIKRRSIGDFAICQDSGEPVMVIGAWLITPGVASVSLFGTDQWLTVARPAYVWGKREFIPCVLEPNVRRAETRVIDRPDMSRAWLARIGFVEEGVARAFGKRGEDFVHVAWINKEIGE